MPCSHFVSLVPIIPIPQHPRSLAATREQALRCLTLATLSTRSPFAPSERPVHELLATAADEDASPRVRQAALHGLADMVMVSADDAACEVRAQDKYTCSMLSATATWPAVVVAAYCQYWMR
jgi:hypothetical protein